MKPKEPKRVPVIGPFFAFLILAAFLAVFILSPLFWLKP